jgi:hypothetical protein
VLLALVLGQPTGRRSCAARISAPKSSQESVGAVRSTRNTTNTPAVPLLAQSGSAVGAARAASEWSNASVFAALRMGVCHRLSDAATGDPVLVRAAPVTTVAS